MGEVRCTLSPQYGLLDTEQVARGLQAGCLTTPSSVPYSATRDRDQSSSPETTVSQQPNLFRGCWKVNVEVVFGGSSSSPTVLSLRGVGDWVAKICPAKQGQECGVAEEGSSTILFSLLPAVGLRVLVPRPVAPHGTPSPGFGFRGRFPEGLFCTGTHVCRDACTNNLGWYIAFGHNRLSRWCFGWSA